jgi:hypothetical protein
MGIAVFKKWMKEATAQDKTDVAGLARTSVSILHQLTYEKRSNGKPFNASPDLAGRIVVAIGAVNRLPRHKPLPDVGRGDLAPGCAKCPYYTSCEEFKE